MVKRPQGLLSVWRGELGAELSKLGFDRNFFRQRVGDLLPRREQVSL